MFCILCGKETEGKFRYCPYCGKNQSEVYEIKGEPQAEEYSGDKKQDHIKLGDPSNNDTESEVLYTFINVSDPPTTIQRIYGYIYIISEYLTSISLLIVAICFIIAFFGGFDSFFSKWGGFGR